MKRVVTPELRRAMNRQNRQRPKELTPVPRDQWPDEGPNSNRIEVWISSKILVQAFDEGDEITRLSINRTVISPDGDWVDGLTWDELQEIKRQAGRGDRWAVEIYPSDQEIVNVANMRHLWLLPEPPSFGWRKLDPV